ncbi:amidase [Metschnikowia bicuspidata var. bicuspidata NRRL YB-4993]|uniref:Amidase n=1 Tax=Metschnikowia bicuspidata var. bicuspidata NRRL YB-4993 TaxID=869754 RepID=A0A1A0HCX2_9ASCO|nr:amidase [Metschnikowia bicuspidata var. bicuspidata NRRL YB-4993]OBA21778.1 amidase [Metschnikowia bicuspidata var. bicuspidata NRRL YB-4993]
MLFGDSNDTTDPAKFENWKTKITAYCQKLSAEVKGPYNIADSELPLDDVLESGINAIEFGEKFLLTEEKEITELEGTVLAKKIAAGEISSVQAFEAYAKRAVIAHQLTNCAMELFLDESLQRAKDLDEYFTKNGKVVGVLHGLPVSVKEHLDIKGKVTHSSFVGWLDHVSSETSISVQNLYDQGAILYVRTSEPQTMMHLCSNNNITGKTRNPWNTKLTPGGSSSGEGAIAAMKGSVFGLGSDIGGSVRAPAAFCGVWGLRPSSKRLSLKHTSCGYVDQVQELVFPVLGPLARSADDLDLFMKAIIDKEPWKTDAEVLPIPWRDAPEPKPQTLKIAIIYDDGYVKPTPPIIRGLKTAAKKLVDAGVSVVEWDNINVKEIVEATYAGYNYDGNHTQKKQLAVSGEPLLPLTAKTFSFGCGDAGLSGLDVQKLCYIRDKNRNQYLMQMNDQGIDFILSPTYVSVASKPETIHYWGYTNLWNMLDFPNVIFPTGIHVDSELDAKDTTYVARNDVEEYEYGLYTSPEDFLGAPVALQLTGRRYTDETVVKAAKVLQAIISK